MRKPTPFHDDIYKNMEYPKKTWNHLKAFIFQNHPLFLKPSCNDGNKYSQKHIRFCATCSTAQSCLTTSFLIHRDHYLSVNFLFLRFCGPFLVSILWMQDSKIFTSQTARLGVWTTSFILQVYTTSKPSPWQLLSYPLQLYL